METFADYILNEKNFIPKIEILYYLSKKTDIYLDKSVIFKTTIAKQFIDYMKIDVDENLVLTACLLCNCKKTNNAQSLGKLKTYALEGAMFLRELGFSKRFCKICEEVNRYSDSNPRERESDILELVDQFGGMLLDRPERIGFETDEALVLLEHRNLRDYYNRFLNTFIEFVQQMDTILITGKEKVKMKAFKRLVKIYNETDDLKEFIKILVYEYAPAVNAEVKKHNKLLAGTMFGEGKNNPNRSLFSEETTRKIMGHIDNSNILSINSNEE